MKVRALRNQMKEEESEDIAKSNEGGRDSTQHIMKMEKEINEDGEGKEEAIEIKIRLETKRWMKVFEYNTSGS